MRTTPPTPQSRARPLWTRREALILTAVVSVAVVAVIAIAMIVSAGDDSASPGATGTAAGTDAAAVTATATGLATQTVTAPVSGAGAGDATEPVPTPTTVAVPTDTAVSAAVEPTPTSLPPLAPTAADGAGDGEPGSEDATQPPGDGGGDIGTEPGTAAEGYIAVGEELSPYAVDQPALANLDPALLAAVQRAADDAEAEGILMVITSGWRSESYQQRLLDEAIVTYGSEEEARKWVLGPEESTHVFGEAVDIGYTDADYWMIERGSAYGLCQTYANEIWHFELMIVPGGSCPAPIEDASHR